MSATTTATKAMSLTIEFPHPPGSLSPNGDNAHWRTKGRDKARLRRDAFALTRQEIWDQRIADHPWPAARLDICWRFAGRQPDADNVVARLKGAIDGMADACIVADDQVISIGAVTFERVKRVEQAVRLTLTREATT